MQNVRSELVVGTAALGAAMLIGFGLSAPRAQAAGCQSLRPFSGTGSCCLHAQIPTGR